MTLGDRKDTAEDCFKTLKITTTVIYFAYLKSLSFNKSMLQRTLALGVVESKPLIIRIIRACENMIVPVVEHDS